jgi:hypothetical protein
MFTLQIKKTRSGRDVNVYQLAEALQVPARGLARRATTLGIQPIRIGHRTVRYSGQQAEAALAQMECANGHRKTVPARDPLTGGRRR